MINEGLGGGKVRSKKEKRKLNNPISNKDKENNETKSK